MLYCSERKHQSRVQELLDLFLHGEEQRSIQGVLPRVGETASPCDVRSLKGRELASSRQDSLASAKISKLRSCFRRTLGSHSALS